MDKRLGEMRSIYFTYLMDQALKHGGATGAIKQDHLRREMSDEDIELFIKFLERKKAEHSRWLDRVIDEARLVQAERAFAEVVSDGRLPATRIVAK